jgi:hypothetical protein
MCIHDFCCAYYIYMPKQKYSHLSSLLLYIRIYEDALVQQIEEEHWCASTSMIINYSSHARAGEKQANKTYANYVTS